MSKIGTKRMWRICLLGSALTMVLAIGSLLGVTSVQASATPLEVGDYKGDRAKAEWLVPEEDGKIFAGWYTNTNYDTVYTKTTGTAYPKFIDEKVLTVKKQLASGTENTSTTTNIRFLTAIDSRMFKGVTFDVQVPESSKHWTKTETVAYSSMLVDGDATPKYADDIFETEDAKFFVAHKFTGIPNAAFGHSFIITPSWETMDGTIVEGKTLNFTINGELLAGSLFADKVSVNGSTVSSAVQKWDITNIASNTLRATSEKGCNNQPMYFAQTGTTMLMQANVTVTSTTEGDPMAGVYVSDGANSGYVGVRGGGIVYRKSGATSNEWHNGSIWGKQLLAPGWSGTSSAQISIVYKEGYFYFYVDGLYGDKVALTATMPEPAANAELAFGLVTYTQDTRVLDMTFNNVSYTTDATTVNEYVEAVYYDPSIEDFIEYARALGQGYENGVGSNKITVDENTTIFIGDSFFERRYFWTDFYTDDYKDANAFCAGIGSTTTDNWTHLIKEVFAVYGDKAPKNIVMHLGTNDLWADTSTADGVVSGLQEVFNILHTKYPETNIYYFGITHRGDGSAADKINSINSTISTWSESQDYLTYIDTPSKITADMLQDDQLHPKLETYSIFVKQLMKAGCVILDKNGQPLPNPYESLANSLFTDEVTINGKTESSAIDKWNISQVENNQITGTNLTDGDVMWFRATGNEAVAQMTVTRKDTSGTNREYQPLAALGLSTGTGYGHIGVRAHGVIKSGSWIEHALSSPVLTTEGHHSTIELEIVLHNGKFLVYVDGLYVVTVDVDQVIAGTNADTNFAFSVVMGAFGNAAELEYSNIRFATGTDAVNTFFLEKAGFASSVSVNGSTVTSALDEWDYSDIVNGNLSGTAALGCNSTPMYFAETGNAMVLRTKVNLEGPTNETRVCLYINDGTNEKYVGIAGKKYVYPCVQGWDWWSADVWNGSMFGPSSWGYINISEVTFAYQAGYIYVITDGVYGGKISIGEILSGATADTQLAFGVGVKPNASYNKITFSDINFTTDATAVNAYMLSKAGLASEVTVNGKTVTSALNKWDCSDIVNGNLSGTAALGCNSTPMYFAETGNAMVLRTKVNLEGPTNETRVCLYINDGTNEKYVGIAGKKYVYPCVQGWDWWSADVWNGSMFGPSSWGYTNTSEVTFAYQAGYIYVITDGVYGGKISIGEILSGATADTQLAFGVGVKPNASYDKITFSDINFTTDATEVSTFVTTITQ